MGKVFFSIIAVFASLALVESLVCNKCSFNVLKLCVPSSSTESCSSNTSVCYNETRYKLTVTSYGCRDSYSSCGSTAVGSALNLGYTVTTGYCSTDKCFSVDSAPSTKMTFAATVVGAILTATWGSIV